MSAELVIIIVGVVLILVAVVDSIRAAEKSLVNTNLRIVMGLLGILLIIYGGYSYGSVIPPGQMEQVDKGNQAEITYPIESVQVLSPVNGDAVKCRILTMGVYPDSHDKDIWVVLQPTDTLYYPQSDHTNTSFKRNGEWQVITRFGGDMGEPFELIVYEADAAASLFFSSTIMKWKSENAYPGLAEEEIPDGAIEVERMTVYLKEDCRGVF